MTTTSMCGLGLELEFKVGNLKLEASSVLGFIHDHEWYIVYIVCEAILYDAIPSW